MRYVSHISCRLALELGPHTAHTHEGDTGYTHALPTHTPGAQVSGYNGGDTFAAYTEFSYDGGTPILIFYHPYHTSSVEGPLANWPTADRSGYGTPHAAGAYELANIPTLLNALCPTTGDFYVGMHNVGTSAVSRVDGVSAQWDPTQWVKFGSHTTTTFVDMFDSDLPLDGFTGTVTRGDGNGDLTYKWRGSHTDFDGWGHVYQMHSTLVNTAHGAYNHELILEFAIGAEALDHHWVVWGDGLGEYRMGGCNNANTCGYSGSTTYYPTYGATDEWYGFMGVAGC